MDSGASDSAFREDSSSSEGGIDAAALDADIGGVGYVMISEVVTTPRSDWSDSAGGVNPYDSEPGTGLVSTRDEFIEIVNRSNRPVDLRGWTLEIIDSAPNTLSLESTTIFFNEGSTKEAFLPNHFAVVGDPAGVLSTNVFILLRNAEGTLIDDVEIGGLSSTLDFERDGIGDGAPSPGENGFARGAFDESIARPDGAVDTDNDQADFRKMVATPLAPNLAAPPPVEEQAPLVVEHTEGSRIAVTDIIQIQFDETLFANELDDHIRVTADGIPIPIGFSTFSDRDRRVHLHPLGRLPYSSTIQVTLKGGTSGVSDLAGNVMTSDYVFSFQTESAPINPGVMVINEICATPQQDWNNSAGGDGIAFSATPGSGTVDSADEWVELLSLHAGTIDLSDYRLVLFSGPTLLQDSIRTTQLSSATTRIFGSGSTLHNISMGDRIVIGNPVGALLGNMVLELRDADGRLIDAVEVGGNSSETDRGGDGVMNGAPAPGESGHSSGVEDEVVARIPDGNDSGNDVADFWTCRCNVGYGKFSLDRSRLKMISFAV